jgi:ElaB/YqjD/DUF883 family membrane-anchored ribosome-binding protein
MAVMLARTSADGRYDARALSAPPTLGKYEVVSGLVKERNPSHLVLRPYVLMETIDMATDETGNGTPFDSARKAFADTAASFSEQAGSKVKDYTLQGKDRAVEALDNVASLVGDAAEQVSERLGEQYGGYIRQAADAVEGLASNLRDKDADELIDDARNMVRSSPAIAIAAAAAVGFVLARVVKSGLTPKAGNDGASGESPASAAAPASDAPAKPVRKTTARKASSPKPKAAAAAPKAEAASSAGAAPAAPSEEATPQTTVTGTSDDTPPAA